MTNSQLQDLEKQLNACEAQIEEVSQLGPDSIFAQLQQGLRASRQELRTLARYLESLKEHREVSTKLLRCSLSSSFSGNSAARSA